MRGYEINNFFRNEKSSYPQSGKSPSNFTPQREITPARDDRTDRRDNRGQHRDTPNRDFSQQRSQQENQPTPSKEVHETSARGAATKSSTTPVRETTLNKETTPSREAPNQAPRDSPNRPTPNREIPKPGTPPQAAASKQSPAQATTPTRDLSKGDQATPTRDHAKGDDSKQATPPSVGKRRAKFASQELPSREDGGEGRNDGREGEGEEGEEEEWDESDTTPIRGTCQDFEKPYFRLTSVPFFFFFLFCCCLMTSFVAAAEAFAG